MSSKHIIETVESVHHSPPTAAREHYPLVPLACDPSEYMDDLADFYISEEQKIEYLQTLWNIMATFVDLGWGVDTVQLFLPEIFEQASVDAPANDNNKEEQNND